MERPLWFPNDVGTELSALLITPDGWLDTPVVVFCQGDPSDAAASLDHRLARELALRGIASLLLDLSSAGGQVTDLTEYSLDRPIADIGSAFDELRVQRAIDVGRIGVAASDVAGTAALLRAAADPRIRALVLRATPAPTVPLPTGLVSAPTLVIVGDDDRPVLVGTRQLQRWFAGPTEFLFVPGAGHHFASASAFAVVLQHTVDWFSRYLGAGAKDRAA